MEGNIVFVFESIHYASSHLLIVFNLSGQSVANSGAEEAEIFRKDKVYSICILLPAELIDHRAVDIILSMIIITARTLLPSLSSSSLLASS